MNIRFLELIPENERKAFAENVLYLANQIQVPVDWLMCIMHFETAGTMSPSRTNSIGAVGLIQFLTYPSEVGATKAQLAKMSHAEQLKYVARYFYTRIAKEPGTGLPKTFVDTYLIVFYPSAANKYGLDTHIGMSHESAVQQADGFYKNGKVTKRNIFETFKARYDWLENEKENATENENAALQNVALNQEQPKKRDKEYDTSQILSFLGIIMLVYFLSTSNNNKNKSQESSEKSENERLKRELEALKKTV